MSLSKNNKNVNLYFSYYEIENQGALRQKKASNVVFLTCALILLIVLVFHSRTMSELDAVLEQIQVHEAFMANPANVEIYNKQLEIKGHIKIITDYSTASDRFMSELQNSERVSRFWVEELQDEMLEAIGGVGNEITSFAFNGKSTTIICKTLSTESPKIFAQYLTELKDENGELKYKDVRYTGFSSADGFSQFTLTFDRWRVYAE